MKRVKGLYKKITDRENLSCALHFASRGKKKRKTVLRTISDKENKLDLLQELLINESYRPMPYSKKTIIDRCTCKIREIYVPKFFPDQIVHGH